MLIKYLKIFHKLIRTYLSLAITFSALTGYIFFKHSIDLNCMYSIIGVFLMSGSALTLNSYQERFEDALMERTKNRPLALKQVEPLLAIMISLFLGILGFTLLFLLTTKTTALLSGFTLLWYNGIYTPLKKKTAFAVLFGALTGALPLIIGYTAAYGSALDSGIIVLAVFMFLWQIPHFWLLMIQYRNDYKSAGFAVTPKGLNEAGLKRIIFIWILASIVCSFSFPFFNVISSKIFIIVLVAINSLFILFFARQLISEVSDISYKNIFRWIYLYQVLILILIAMDAVFS